MIKKHELTAKSLRDTHRKKQHALVATLLVGVPVRGCKFSRVHLARMIKCAFFSGVAAQYLNKPRPGKN